METDLSPHRGRADLKDYRLIQYESGLEVLLVSTKQLCMKRKSIEPLSAVGLCVQAGSFSDPYQAEGIAHFLGRLLKQ